MRGVVVAEYRQHAQHLHPGRVERDQDLRLLAMALARGVGFAHDDGDLAARIAGAGGPPLAPVDHIVVAVLLDACLDVGGVRGGDRRLGHQEGRADFAVHQRAQPLVLLGLRPVAVQHLHVASVGRGAVEHLGRPGQAAHLLGAEGVFEVAEAGALVFAVIMLGRGRQEHVPQPLGPGLGLQVLDDLRRLPAIGSERLHLRLVGRGSGADVGVDEAGDPVAPAALPLGKREVHRSSPRVAHGERLSAGRLIVNRVFEFLGSSIALRLGRHTGGSDSWRALTAELHPRTGRGRFWRRSMDFRAWTIIG